MDNNYKENRIKFLIERIEVLEYDIKNNPLYLQRQKEELESTKLELVNLTQENRLK